MVLFEVNVDLERERRAATFSSEEFAIWWAGGREALQKQRALEKRFLEDPDFEDPVPLNHLSNKELFEHTVVKSTKFLTKLKALEAEEAREEEEKERKASSGKNGKKKKSKGLLERMYDFRMLLTGRLGSAIFPQSFPLRLHYSMFLTTLLNQSTKEQQDQWLEKAANLQGILGTYAQTELGHGTFIRGLETRAEYDEKTQEFVLNTPSLSAYKWWPGGLGHFANMVVILAQLYVQGKHCGLYPFLLRVRDEDTHQPLPGVDIGEIGPKIGGNGINNGFLGLNNVRIPRTQMLMKYAEVSPDGTFIKKGEPILTYSTMVFVRVLIVRDVMFSLLQAATVATRYSAVRRQSPIEPHQPEHQIFDHLTQQAKVLPQISKGICYRFAADFVWQMYQKVLKELETGNRRNLPELHALTCCLKAVCSKEAADGVEILRKACGGHGYLASANFNNMYANATAACTYEGENTVLLLQTARFLVKNYVDGLKRKVLPKSVTYLRITARLSWSKDISTLVKALEIAACEKVRIAFEYQRKKQKEFKSPEMGSNLSGLKLTQAASLHGHVFLANTALNELRNLKTKFSPDLGKVMKQILELFIVDTFLGNAADIVAFAGVNGKQILEVEGRYEQLLLDIRRNAVAIVDGFDFHDRILGSTLGCYDGRVYERLMAEARKSPLNQEPVNPTFHSHLKPFMLGKL